MSDPDSAAGRPAPPVALLLGYSGLIPFVGLTAAAFVTADGSAWPTAWFALYSAVILSFLGGIRWGVYASRPDPNPFDVVFSIVISLWAFGSLLLDDTASTLTLLLLGHLLAAGVDWMRPPAGQSAWLRSLRPRLSVVASVCHVILLLG